MVYLSGFPQGLVTECSVEVGRGRVDRVESNGGSQVLNGSNVGLDKILQRTPKQSTQNSFLTENTRTIRRRKTGNCILWKPAEPLPFPESKVR